MKKYYLFLSISSLLILTQTNASESESISETTEEIKSMPAIEEKAKLETTVESEEMKALPFEETKEELTIKEKPMACPAHKAKPLVKSEESLTITDIE